MNIQTRYLGLELDSPLVASASPLMTDVSNIRHMEDAGASAVVLNSLYEEQIRMEQLALDYHLEYGTESFPEALSYFPEPEEYNRRREDYLRQIEDSKAAVDIPVIASLNGATIGGWTRFAKKIEAAGADALELNIYYIPTDLREQGYVIEQSYVGIAEAVSSAISIPVAVKLSPYFSNMANMASQLDQTGIKGLVMFNRFYQPDLDLETMTIQPNVLLSTPYDLRLPMRWIAILYGHIEADMAATSGIHRGTDVIKVLLVGATVAMMTSAILQHGIDHFGVVKQEMLEWMEENEYESVSQMRGSFSQLHVDDPSAFERAQYLRGLTTYMQVQQQFNKE